MILTKMVVNTVANKLAKHFKLDKMMNYVFEDNELDEKTKNHEDRIRILESMAHPQRDFVVCQECKQKIKETRRKNNG